MQTDTRGSDRLPLIVFIAVALAAMAGPCLPFLSLKSKDRVRRASCLSNVKQIGLGLLMYEADSQDRLPPTRAYPREVLPYLKNATLLRCPQDPDGTMPGYALHPMWDRRELSTIQRRDAAVLVYEAREGVPAYRHKWKRAQRGFLERPAERLTIGYCDGHAAYRLKKELPPDDIMRGYDLLLMH